MKLQIKTFFILAIMFLFINSTYSQQNVNGWYWANSQPQSNDLNWVQIVNAGLYYAAGVNGAFMKSTDGGDSWIINTEAGITDELSGVGSSRSINSGWFFNANTGIVVGSSNFNDGGIIKRTTDGGMTFTEINLGLPAGLPSVRDIHFINSMTGFICGNEIVKAMKTTNGGLSWNPLPNLSSFFFSYSTVFATDVNNIYLGVNHDRKVIRTSDGGNTWIEDLLPGTASISFTDIEFINSSTGFISGNPAYFAYTTNSGVTWTESPFPDSSTGIYDLETEGSNVYALGPFNNYYFTSDLGINWSAVNFNDATNIHQPVPLYVYAFDINGNDAIVVGANGKVNLSNDNGSSWRNKNYSVGNNEAMFPSVYALPGTNNVWSGGSNGSILASTNNGDSWYKYQTSAAFNFYDIEMLNSSTGYAVGGFFVAGVGYCYKTTNGGISWSPLTLPVTNVPVNGLTFVDQNTGWIFGGYALSTNPGLMYKTTNGGVTWTSQAVSPSDNSILVDGDMADANTGYCTGGNKVWKTTNGGIVWNRVMNIPDNISWNSVKAFSGSTVYVGGTGSINKSTNGGVSWQSVSIPNNNDPVFKSDWFDQNNGTAVGVMGYTAKTSDGGITWEERNTGSSTLTGVSMSSANLVYASSDRNVSGAIFRLSDNITSITLNLNIGIEGFWNGVTQVGDTVRCHLRNSVSPFNEVEVATAVLINSGSGTFIFNSAPSGSYYIEITHRNSIETWNANPLTFTTGETYSYNFTTSASQAYGNNMTHIFGRYCNYSGDINQDGDVNLTDLVETYNASSVFTTGYVSYDVNGDNIVDLSDLTYIYNNSRAFVSKITP